MVPSALADSRKGGFAEAHFEFVAENKAYDQLLAAGFCALARGHGRGKNVGRVRRVLFPVDIVVIHATNHQCVGEGCGDGINPLPGSNDRGGTASSDFVEDLRAIFTSCC